LGVKSFPGLEDGGAGVRIAIVDSGTPTTDLLKTVSSCSYGPKDQTDDVFGHATEIASILFGGGKIQGLCPNANPFYVKVLNDTGNGSIRSVVDGINKAIDYDVDIINLSLGFARTEKCPKKLEKVCERAFQAGKTIVCAAGNDGSHVCWPAALETTISVGSAGKDGFKTAFSSFGEIDFVAPGTDIPVFDKDGRYKTVSGTSFSAAIVTGVVALSFADLAKRSGTRPSPDDLKTSLQKMAVDLGREGWDELTGYGYISGQSDESSVCLKIDDGFFGKIIGNIRGFFGFG